MKVLLINPPIREGEAPNHVPIGLGIIASVLLNDGHDVEILDINAERLSKSEVEKRLDLDSRHDVIGTGGLITTYKYLKWLIPEIRKRNPRSKIVIGGGVVTAEPTLLLSRTPADIAVVGDGELTMREIVSVQEHNGSLESVLGIVYKNGDGIKVNPPRPVLKNLDDYPFPSYDLLPMDIYLRNVAHASSIGKKTEISIITSRGCPYNCRFCYHIFGKGVRTRSVDDVIDEIKHLIENYGVESLLILDETFTINKKRVMEFCDKMLSEKIKIPWSCYARVNLVDKSMLKKMKEAGCYRVGYGIESGSQRILDNMGKKVTVAQAKEAVKLTRSVGLKCGTTFMFGYTGENLETIEETSDFCRELLISPSFFFTTPYPGCELYHEVKDRIIDKYGGEEQFIEALGDAMNFTINLTDFSDEELFRLKDQTEKKLRKRPLHKYPERLYILYKELGFYPMVKRLITNRLRRRITSSELQ